MSDVELDRLFGLPLGEFVSARNALARELRRSGDADGAEVLRTLPKPTPPAWVLNQLVRARRNLIEEVISALERVKVAQLGALSSEAPAISLREAMKEEREAAQRLLDAAPDVLAQLGYRPSNEVLERAMRTLRAVAHDPERRKVLEKGRLIEEVEENGFATLAAQLPALRETERATVNVAVISPPIDLEAERRKREAEARKAEEEARRRREEEARRLDEARHLHKKRLAESTQLLESLRAAESVLARELVGLERELNEARRKLKDAESAWEGARAKLEETQAKGREAELRLEQLHKETPG